VLADLLTSAEGDLDDLVREALRRHPPAPFSLWRFTTEEVELAGATLPARSPLLIDILGIGTDPERRPGPDLAFGAGPHYCMGVQLAALELRAVAEVVRADFPGARLAVPRAAADVLLLGEVTSPGNFRYDRIVKHRDYAAAGILFSLRVDLENGPDAVEATLFELIDGEYREAVRSVDGVLRSSVPWPFEADLRALASGRS
jgi:hypothetical protein